MGKMKFELVEEQNTIIDSSDTLIKVVGIGGCGCNVINDMCQMTMRDVELIAINTDSQSLNKIDSHEKIQIGKKVAKGRGTGNTPEKAQKSAEEDRNIIENKLRGADMVVLVAGVGGGTGSGAGPVIADIARGMDILTAAFVITPFNVELNEEKSRIVRESYASLKDKVDMIVDIPNEKILELFTEDTGMDEAYKAVNIVLIDIMRGLVKMISKTGIQNIDFADVKRAMKGKGNSFMGVGKASGANRAKTAFENAIKNRFMGNPNLNDANFIVINFFGNMSVGDIKAIEELKLKYTGAGAMVKFGHTNVADMGDEIEVTMLISGLHDDALSGQGGTSEAYNQFTPLAAASKKDESSKPEESKETVDKEIQSAIEKSATDFMEGNYENEGLAIPTWQRIDICRRHLPKLN